MLFRKERISVSPEITEKVRKDYNQNRPEAARTTACFAPMKNLYFGHHGRISSCCYNRHYVLGTYPEHSIREIWFGKRAEKLRNYLEHYNFSLGCGDCKQVLVAGNYDGLKSTMYDQHRLNKNLYPSVFEFELNNACNLECVMCSGDFSSLIRKNREKRNELLTPYDDDFIRQLDEFIPHLVEVKFYGGEPFLIELYYDIWKKIIAVNPSVRISVQTNGTILNNRVKEILSKTNFHINLSLDSIQKENYEAIRVNAKFDRVMEHLQYFHSYCKDKDTFFGISACMMTTNWQEAPDFIRLCNSLQVPVYFHPITNPAKYSLKQLDELKLIEICSQLEAELVNIPQVNAIEKKNKKHYKDFLSQLHDWKKNAASSQKDTSDIKNMSDFVEHVATKTKSRTDLPPSEMENRVPAFEEKLTLLQQALPQNFDLLPYFMHLLNKEGVSLNTFVEGFEAKNLDEIKEHISMFYKLDL
ncbi:MAG: radical SAM protein [Chitinophagales bacterium]|nr:radical SAM protein [Chitinophagales bacterium]